VTVRIAVVGDENDALASHRELNAVRPMHYCGYGPGPGVLELPGNRFFMLTLFQPQIGALAGKPVHPLLGEFVRCAREYAGQAVAGEASSSASS